MKFLFTHWFSNTCRLLLTFLVFLEMATVLNAQATCPYTLVLTDDFGDSWFGGQLTLEVNGNVQTFALDFDVFEETHNFSVTEGEPIVLTWSPGFFGGDEGITLIDSEGNEVFSVFSPLFGELYNEVAQCPSCLAPSNPYMSDVNATNAALSWTVFDGYAGTYRVEYDSAGFIPGNGNVKSVPYPTSSVVLDGLNQKTDYDVYVFLDCGPDSSEVVGPIEFQTIWMNDVGVTNITQPGELSCNLGNNEIITIEMTNFGQAPQTLFEFFFAVNGQVASVPMPQDGLFTGVIGNDSTQSISFETTWDFLEPGFYTIEAWTVLEGDTFPANDTFQLEVQTAFQLPVQEDFEDEAFPANWETNGFIYLENSHNNETVVLGHNLYSFQPSFNLDLDIVGPVSEGDTLFFDYRYVNFFDGTIPTTLGPNDQLVVQVSEDCGETFEDALVINSSNHTSTVDMANRFLSLEDYDGLAIAIRFVADWGSGDYWLDLDNINLSGCPITFGTISEVTGTEPGIATGEITVEPSFGTPPYSFEWDNGETSETISNLEQGQYSLTITDANGCVGVEEYEVGTLVSTDEADGVEQVLLFPNPTAGLTILDVTFSEAMDFQMQVLNLNGQIVFERKRSNAVQVKEEFDLSNQPDGIYILQLVVNGESHFAKLILAK